MYYIVNHTHQIIAADSDLLELITVEDINEFYTKIALGDIKFSSVSDGKVTITTSKSEKSYATQSHTLSGMLGDITLIQMQTLEKDDNTAPAIQKLLAIETTETMEKDEVSVLDGSREEVLEKDDEESILDSAPIPLAEPIEELSEEPALRDDDTPLEEELLVTENTEENKLSVLEEILKSENETNEETFPLVESEEEIPKESISKDEIFLFDDIKDEISLLDNDPISLIDNTEELPEESIKKDESTTSIEELPTAEENEIFILDDISKEQSDTEVKEHENDEIFELILPDTTKETIDTIDLAKNEQIATVDNKLIPIVIDISKISQCIGISSNDYTTFLNEYIDTALTLEKDLYGTKKKQRSSAINTLSHLSNVLHLSVIHEIITKIENSTEDERSHHIDSFYTTLSRLTTSQLETVNKEISPESDIEVDNIILQEEIPLRSTESKSVPTTLKSFGTIDLSDVQPIHFDFKLETAAEELSLPIELIKEFVNDFAEQARTETKKMVAAYEQGDLDTIQKIGHLLKGASSNLRINPLSDTLYEIQFSEDHSKLEELIKNYWGHFLSLENRLNLISK